jgi:hypothetical protein
MDIIPGDQVILILELPVKGGGGIATVVYDFLYGDFINRPMTCHFPK